MDWHTGETIPAAAERISTEARLDEGHDAPTFCFVLLRVATQRVTRSEDVHSAGTHVFGRWLTCLICGRDIAEKCRECRRLHRLRHHAEPAR